MRFSGKIDYTRYVRLVKDILYDLFVRDVSFNEGISIRITPLYVGQIGQITCIGQVVDIDDLHIFSILQQMSNEVRPNESTAACDQNFHRVPIAHFCLLAGSHYIGISKRVNGHPLVYVD
jgi:hypothetical protein